MIFLIRADVLQIVTGAMSLMIVMRDYFWTCWWQARVFDLKTCLHRKTATQAISILNPFAAGSRAPCAKLVLLPMPPIIPAPSTRMKVATAFSILALTTARNWASIRFGCVIDFAERFRRSLRIATWLLALLVVIGAVLDTGVWKGTESFSGPFRLGDAARRLYTVEIGTQVPFWLGMRMVPTIPPRDTPNPHLSVDGRTVPLPVAPRARFQRSAAIWLGLAERQLQFPLPPSVINDQRLKLSATYVVRFHSTFHDGAVWALVLVILLRLTQLGRMSACQQARLAMVVADLMGDCNSAMVLFRSRWKIAADHICSAQAFLFRAASYAAIAICIFYALTIGYGIFEGRALPSATILTRAPAWLSLSVEPVLPLVLLAIAATGAAFAWAGSLGILPAERIRQSEARLILLWGRCGLPAIICLLLFALSAGGWSGHIRSFDVNYMSIAGLVPHSDPNSYFSDVYRQAFWDHWSWMGSRRPTAEALRALTVYLGGFSYVGTLLVQLGLISGALFLAVRTVVRWHGIWAGIAFVALVCIQVRSFLVTTLTEPLALIVVLFSIVFLLDALRLKSLPHALLALAGLTFALMVRMGAVFLIPLMIGWIVFFFATSLGARLRLLALASGVVTAVVAVNWLLAWLFTFPHVMTGDNFAWVACGLSLGSNWTTCNNLYHQELAQIASEKEKAMFLLAAAWSNFLQHPDVLFHKLYSNSWEYLKDLPRFMFEGYGRYFSLHQVSDAFAQSAVLVLIASLVYVNRVRSAFFAVAFWIMFFVAIDLSAAVILGDDGWRTLHVTHAVVACFLAMGFAAPTVFMSDAKAPSLRWQTGAVVFVITGALLLVGPVMARAWAQYELRQHAPATEVALNENVVSGGRFLSGFLVVPDDARRPLSIPSLPISKFVEIIRLMRLENDFGPFLLRAVEHVPFAFITAGRLDGPGQGYVYVAPPIVLQRRDVWAWRFKLSGWVPSGIRWPVREVLTAEPIP